MSSYFKCTFANQSLHSDKFVAGEEPFGPILISDGLKRADGYSQRRTRPC